MRRKGADCLRCAVIATFGAAVVAMTASAATNPSPRARVAEIGRSTSQPDLTGTSKQSKSKTTASPSTRTELGTGIDHSFPSRLWAAFLAIAVFGAVGAFGTDLVADGGRIEFPTRTETGLMLGWPGKTVVGAVAALITLMLNPPDRAWATLIGTALSAGVGGEALLLAIVARRQADAAQHAVARERERVQAVARSAQEQIDAVRQTVLATFHDTLTDAARASANPAPGDAFERSVNSAFSQARRAVAAVLGPSSPWDEVREILVRRLSRSDVDTRPLGELADARTLRRIAHDITQHWPHLTPAWSNEDITPDSTLASIVNEIDGRIA